MQKPSPPMPSPALGRRTSRPHCYTRHNRPRRRFPLLAVFGMLLFATLFVLVTPRLQVLSPVNAAMTSYQAPHHDPGEWQQQQQSVEAPHAVSELPESNRQQRPLTMEANQLADEQSPLADLPETLIADLPAKYALRPETDGGSGGKRLIFVGDVHGHLAVLKALLTKVGFDRNNGDHLVLLGDIVAKGPDSAGVVALAMELDASAVRGNHEDEVLRAHKAMQKKHKKKKNKQKPWVDGKHGAAADAGDQHEVGSEEEGVEDGAVSADRLSARQQHARVVARSLSAKQLKWLSSLPIMLQLGAISGAASPPWNAKEVVVVHAGLVPSVPLDQQDPWAVMNMRTLVYPTRKTRTLSAPPQSLTHGDESAAASRPKGRDRTIGIPSDSRDGEPWSQAWNRFQNTAVPLETNRTLVIYGHDAKKDLQANMKIRVKPHPALDSDRRHRSTKRGKVEINASDYAETELEIESDEAEVEAEFSDAEIEVDFEKGSNGKKQRKRDDTEVEIEAELGRETEVEVEAESGDFEVELELEHGDDNDEGDGGSDKKQQKRDTAEAIDMARKRRGRKHRISKGIRYAIGLYSGCGQGRKLTALVVEAARPDGVVVHRIEQVDCADVDETNAQK